MKIQIVTPAAAAPGGNWVTARRYARLLARLGHRVSVDVSYEGGPCDLLIALHAWRSLDSIRRFRGVHPRAPLILVLTGTDLYRDIRIHSGARWALESADRIIVLQPMGLRALPSHLRRKTSVIHQSAENLPARPGPATYFRVINMANLRPEKDPFRTALAAARLPASSRVRVIHVGRALDRRMEEAAREQASKNPRYRWVGGLPHWKARRILASSHLLVLTSRIEGSSNALSEALASSVPVIASKIPGLVGTLGREYPGYFPVGNARALAGLLLRAESDSRFLAGLRRRCARLAPLISPERELNSWNRLLRSIWQG